MYSGKKGVYWKKQRVCKAESWGLSSVSLRLTAPSAEGAFWGKRLRTRDFASAEARRWTEPVWQLSDRPRHPFGPLL